MERAQTLIADMNSTNKQHNSVGPPGSTIEEEEKEESEVIDSDDY